MHGILFLVTRTKRQQLEYHIALSISKDNSIYNLYAINMNPVLNYRRNPIKVSRRALYQVCTFVDFGMYYNISCENVLCDDMILELSLCFILEIRKLANLLEEYARTVLLGFIIDCRRGMIG